MCYLEYLVTGDLENKEKHLMQHMEFIIISWLKKQKK